MQTYEIKDYSTSEYESCLKEFLKQVTSESWDDAIKQGIVKKVLSIVENRFRKSKYLTEYKKSIEQQPEKEFRKRIEEASSLALMSYNDETFYTLEFKVIEDFLMLYKEFEKNPVHFILQIMEQKGIVKTEATPSLLSRHRMLSKTVNKLWIDVYCLVKGGSYSYDELLMINGFSHPSPVGQEYLDQLRDIRIKMGVAEYLEPEEETNKDLCELISVLEEIKANLEKMYREAKKLIKNKMTTDDDMDFKKLDISEDDSADDIPYEDSVGDGEG